ncbi:hypothetical protein QAD02_013922 [Eretmocerus hayati]|uniref:Uncharacterized protein n=1 Tax=Eretmocerus hayati TaxID=131215 RepID=A0ACC2P8N4_9HYME|nr:hypothetical protein QAD02_013922 [Eretmocerus hayati]
MESVMIDPQLFQLGEMAVKKFLMDIDQPSIHVKPVYAVQVPSIRCLRVFSELPGIYDQTMAHIAKLERSNVISNHVQGTMWRTNYAASSRTGDGGFPLRIWCDDFQTGNGMSSAEFKQKLGGVYVRCPTLPPHLLSKLYNIFSTVIFYAKHREDYGNRCVFCKIIGELTILHERGLRVVINKEEKNPFLRFDSTNWGLFGIELCLELSPELYCHKLLSLLHSYGRKV